MGADAPGHARQTGPKASVEYFMTRVVSASSLNSFRRNIKSVDFSKFLTVDV